MSDQCPVVCTMESNISRLVWANQPTYIVDCPRCGKYQLAALVADYFNMKHKSDSSVAIVSYAIRKMQKNKEQDYPLLDIDRILQLLENPLPKPSEQINNFVIWLVVCHT